MEVGAGPEASQMAVDGLVILLTTWVALVQGQWNTCFEVRVGVTARFKTSVGTQPFPARIEQQQR